MTGVKAETRAEVLGAALHAQAFAAEVASRYRRDEIQGAGISGPYVLRDRNILANSEKVAIEVRDRLRSEIIVNRRELSRFIDYDIDALSGTISFREPVLSRDFDLNPQFIVIDYEAADGFGKAQWTPAPGRWDYRQEKRNPRGATEQRRGEPPAPALRHDLRSLGHHEIRARLQTDAGWRERGAQFDGCCRGEPHGSSSARYGVRRPRLGTGQQNGVELGRRKSESTVATR